MARLRPACFVSPRTSATCTATFHVAASRHSIFKDWERELIRGRESVGIARFWFCNIFISQVICLLMRVATRIVSCISLFISTFAKYFWQKQCLNLMTIVLHLYRSKHLFISCSKVYQLRISEFEYIIQELVRSCWKYSTSCYFNTMVKLDTCQWCSNRK